MSFMPTSPSRGRLVPGFGKLDAKIAIVGDFTTAFDDRELRPFSGPPGTALEQCLQVAGILKAEVYLTNAIKSKTSRPYKVANTEYFDDAKRKFTELGLEHAAMLRAEIEKIGANVIVTAGNAALAALTDFSSVAKYRGYVVGSTKLSKVRKIIPTYSPASTMRAYVHRHMIVADLKKAKMEAAFPEIVRPQRTLIYDYANVEEALQWLQYLNTCDELAFDIEVINYEVSAVSFSPKPDLAIVIPFGTSDFKPQGWKEDEELLLWRGVQMVLGNAKIRKVVQNGAIFDTHFLLTKNGIEIAGEVCDTMIGHSCMFPELPKGLDFLGSIYCGSQEYWKDSVKWNNIKGES